MPGRIDDLDCPRCGRMFSATTIDGMRPAQGPAIRAAVLQGDLNLFICPGCGEQLLYERPFLYLDLERLHVVLVLPEQQLPAWTKAEAEVEDLYAAHVRDEPTRRWSSDDNAARFQVRAVFGLPALREKLMLWDAGLDDRVFEMVKMHVLRLRPELVEQQYLRLVLDRLEAETFVLYAAAERGAALAIECAVSGYRAVEAERAAHASAYPDLFSRAFVDFRRYAQESPRASGPK